MADISTWSAVAANNGFTPPDGFPEAQAPSTVNDSAREMMAAIVRGVGDLNGARMLFQQTAAPTHWTKDTTANLNDTALRVVTGTVGSVTAQQAFSAVIGGSGKTATNAHALTVSEIPSHNHRERGDASANMNEGAGAGANTSFTTESTNSATALNTGNTGGGGSHSHNMDIRVNHHDVVLCSKD